MRIRLDRDDDLLHPVDGTTTFNESRYYNFAGGEPSPVGGWVRMGNRPNEGHAEMTVCLYLPDGRVGFMYRRPEISGNTAHDAGGLRFDVVEPFVEHRVHYAGRVLVMADPRDLADPSAAFAANPQLPCTIELTHRAVARPWGGEPEWDDGEAPAVDEERSFARGHTEQHMAVRGTVTVGEERFDIDGFGLRDHSWGPRSWQSIRWYRWLTANFGPDLGFALTVSGTDDGGRRSHGFVHDRVRSGDDGWVPIRDVELRSEYDADWYRRALRVVLHTDEHRYDVEGTVWSNVPLRNRRRSADGEVLTTRIAEGMTAWRCGEQAGSGLAEYLDQVVDGVPLGPADGG